MLPRERIYNNCSLVPRLVLICFLLGSLWFSLVLLLVLLCFAFESPWLSLSFSSAFFLVFFGSPWFCFWLFFIATTVIITISGPFCGALGPSRGHLGAILGPRWARLDLIFQGAQRTLKTDHFWIALRPSWSHLGTISGPSGGPSWGQWPFIGCPRPLLAVCKSASSHLRASCNIFGHRKALT